MNKPGEATVVPRQLGESGARWVQQSLESGDAFARAVLEAVSLRNGEARTFLPPDAGTNLDLSDASFHPDGPWSLQQGWEAAEAAIAFLRRIGGEVILVEDGVSRANLDDPELALSPAQVLTIGDAVLRWRPLLDGTANDIVAFVGNQQPGGNAFVLTGLLRSFKPLEEIETTMLGALARSVQAIVVGAFDGVSYVVWTATERKALTPSGS